MTALVNIVVTCTKKKSVEIPERLRFRHVPRAKINVRVHLWHERLRLAKVEAITVRELYCGDHWSVARSIENLSLGGGATVRLWVASAGYGLVSPDGRIKAYSATFSKSHPDSINGKTAGGDWSSNVLDWWRLVSKWSDKELGHLRSIEEVASNNPKSPLLVIASEDYLAAVKEDLTSARDSLASVDLLSIFSAGSKSIGNLTDHLVPCDARLQRVVGGALRSLNIRVARKALADCRRSSPTLSYFRNRFDRLMRQQPKFEQPKRHPMTDAEVRKFITKELRLDRDAYHTPLLRKLRDRENACEQKRFSILFQQVAEQLNGSR